MQIVIMGNDRQKEEILSHGISNDCRIDWISSPAELSAFTDCHAFFDLLFEENGYDTLHLKYFLSIPVFVNSVNKTIGELGIDVIRINGWPGFLQRSIIEMSCKEGKQNKAMDILQLLDRKVERVPDVKGFISSRVIGMIINEAYFALEENVSTKEEIDTAMKLGTNYPYGPFEWGEKIGLKKIAGLLSELSVSEKRYAPSTLLLKETEQSWR